MPVSENIFVVSATNRMRDIGIALLGPVVQSIVSLTSSLKGQLIKCFMTS